MFSYRKKNCDSQFSKAFLKANFGPKKAINRDGTTIYKLTQVTHFSSQVDQFYKPRFVYLSLEILNFARFAFL